MSAIWGEIRKNGQVSNGKEQEIEESLSKYCIDRIHSIQEENILIGCGIQFVTKEAEAEQLPQKRDGFYYTADVMIDNREQLLKELGLEKDAPDGEILFGAFLKWKEQMVDHVIGIFSAVFYHPQTECVWIFTDHTGSRCINYCIEDDNIYFSTTIEPIIKMRRRKTEICKKWLVACASNCSADLYLYESLTPFKDIYQLEAGHYLKIEKGKVQKVQYWNPKKLPKLRVSDEEALQLFRDTFEQCIKDVLRSNGNTGITLSSGLDSTSVACVAARILKEKGQVLHSYTAVPLKEFVGNGDSSQIINEEAGVRVLAKDYDNIDMSFLECRGKDAISDLERLVPILECPYKSGVNLVWLDEIYATARKEGCRLILKGQFGNSTISYGSILTTVYQLISSGHLIRAFHEMHEFGKAKHIRMRNVIRGVLMAYKGIFFKNTKLKDTFLREGLKEQYGIDEQIARLDRIEGGGGMDSKRKHLGFMYSLRVFEHLGAFDTRLGLANGIIIRDPTKDKRIIELCMRLPITAFASEGIERRLVRKGMKGIVPKEILEVWLQRGVQGIDYLLRFQSNWPSIQSKVNRYLDNKELKEYISQQKLEEIKKAIDNGIENDMEKTCIELLTICSMSQFFESIKA